MTRLKALLWVIALSQFVLGFLVLLVPGPFLGWMGLTVPPVDTGYMLGMLGARFLAYGLGMAMLARAPVPELFWIRNMVLIQIIDFGVGALYLAQGRITLATAAFPMMNAALFAAGLWLLAPERKEGMRRL